MSNIRINPRKLDSAATKLRRIAQEMEEERNEVAHTEGNIEQAWVSEYREVLIDDLQTTCNNIKKLASITNSLAIKLNKIASEARRIERLNAAGFSGGGGGGGR